MVDWWVMIFDYLIVDDRKLMVHNRFTMVHNELMVADTKGDYLTRAATTTVEEAIQ